MPEPPTAYRLYVGRADHGAHFHPGDLTGRDSGAVGPHPGVGTSATALGAEQGSVPGQEAHLHALTGAVGVAEVGKCRRGYASLRGDTDAVGDLDAVAQGGADAVEG